MEIADRLLKRLGTLGPQPQEALLAAFPEFDEDPCRIEAVRLVLRLNTRVRLLDDGRWALATAAQTPEDRIANAAWSYLVQVPGSGATLNTVVNHVCGQTGFEDALVRSVIRQTFDCRGALVFKKAQEVR